MNTVKDVLLESEKKKIDIHLNNGTVICGTVSKVYRNRYCEPGGLLSIVPTMVTIQNGDSWIDIEVGAIAAIERKWATGAAP